MMDPRCHRLLVGAANYHLLPYQQNTLPVRRARVRRSADSIPSEGVQVAHESSEPSNHLAPHLTQLPKELPTQCGCDGPGFLYVAEERTEMAPATRPNTVSTLSRVD
ncbi:kelch-like protein 31 [Lates japonicus]|uniref:Kelch-like protein 31 n=1 Tax=Lates japonicus TaxID=270547 RepID=A0AAD3MSX1_LATJO|nr:kelch-like protein 31 [Lates japonicus]